MDTFWIILILLAPVLMTSLTLFSIVIQSYIYTEASPAIYWQAPLSGLVLALFLGGWAFLNLTSPQAHRQNVPYPTLLWGSFTIDMGKQPMKEIWVIRTGAKKPIKYVLQKYVDGIGAKTRYVRDRTGDFWKPEGIKAVVLRYGETKIRFEPQAPPGTDSRFYASEGGWIMPERDGGVTGNPYYFHYGLLAANIVLNALHLLLWISCLWLLLRFQLGHAFGLGFLIWLMLSLTLVPWLTTEAAALAPRFLGS